MEFRTLRADEIEVRVGSITRKGITLLLYKDARCDMNILDDAVGKMNWERVHSRENRNCTVKIWDEDKRQWVEKEDTGTESYTEKEKGVASDSFKRACVNWGIGRELYTSPFIFINVQTEPKPEGRGYQLVNTNDQYGYAVSKIRYGDNRNIIALEIVKGASREVVFSTGGFDTIDMGQAKVVAGIAKQKGLSVDWVMDKLGIAKLGDMTQEQYAKIVKVLDDYGKE